MLDTCDTPHTEGAHALCSLGRAVYRDQLAVGEDMMDLVHTYHLTAGKGVINMLDQNLGTLSAVGD